MAALLTSAKTNTTGTGASHAGPCTVWVRGTFDNCSVIIETCDDNVNYQKLKEVEKVKYQDRINIDAYGTYYVRAVLRDAGSKTNITVVSTQ